MPLSSLNLDFRASCVGCALWICNMVYGSKAVPFDVNSAGARPRIRSAPAACNANVFSIIPAALIALGWCPCKENYQCPILIYDSGHACMLCSAKPPSCTNAMASACALYGPVNRAVAWVHMPSITALDPSPAAAEQCPKQRAPIQALSACAIFVAFLARTYYW